MRAGGGTYLMVKSIQTIGYWVGSHWVGRQSTTALLNPETKLKGTPNKIAETSLNWHSVDV